MIASAANRHIAIFHIHVRHLIYMSFLFVRGGWKLADSTSPLVGISRSEIAMPGWHLSFDQIGSQRLLAPCTMNRGPFQPDQRKGDKGIKEGCWLNEASLVSYCRMSRRFGAKLNQNMGERAQTQVAGQNEGM